VWTDVVAPVLGVRLCLLAVGWLSQNLLPNPQYPAPEALARGYHFSRSRLLDMWARWDSGWYMGIVQHGYPAGPVAEGAQSAFAFFPLYPMLVRIFTLLLPERLRTAERILIVGLLLSNVFLIGALILLHRLVTEMRDRETARRTVLYTLLFPTGFFLFCFYTESAFLLLSVAAFYAASRKWWGAAGLLGGLLALARPPGVLIAVPLCWMYLESVGWRPSKIRANVLWLALVPSGLLAFLFYAYRMTGDFLAPVHAQGGWGKTLTAPWTTLLQPFGGDFYVTSFERVLAVVFIALAVVALFKLPSAAYGVYALLLIAPPLTSGTLVSTSRYCVVVFPAFVVLAALGRHPLADDALKLALFGLQVWLFVGWSQSYWVV
jgi:Mannosyltransferase (PIG-V)